MSPLVSASTWHAFLAKHHLSDGKKPGAKPTAWTRESRHEVWACSDSRKLWGLFLFLGCASCKPISSLWRWRSRSTSAKRYGRVDHKATKGKRLISLSWRTLRRLCHPILGWRSTDMFPTGHFNKYHIINVIRGPEGRVNITCDRRTK